MQVGQDLKGGSAAEARKGPNHISYIVFNIVTDACYLLFDQALNEEQLILLSSKASVERALTDIEGLKAQLEEVAREV
jgi:hypothetical protein